MKNTPVKAAALLSILSSQVLAQGEPGSQVAVPIMEELPPHLAERIRVQYDELQLSDLNDEARAYVSRLKLWPTNRPVTVCYFGGSPALKEKISTIASTWDQAAPGLTLNFGTQGNRHDCRDGRTYDIRVGYAYKGYWSLVGTDSRDLAPQYEQSLNLAFYDVNPPAEPAFSRYILHEFGHAIGLQHEHQSPRAPCSAEFNWPQIYKYLSGDPNYWDKDKVDHNMRPKEVPEGRSTRFDPESIMLYRFSKEFYVEGVDAACYIEGNDKPSQTDLAAVRELYSEVADASGSRGEALRSYITSLAAANIETSDFLAAQGLATNIARGPMDLFAGVHESPYAYGSNSNSDGFSGGGYGLSLGTYGTGLVIYDRGVDWQALDVNRSAVGERNPSGNGGAAFDEIDGFYWSNPGDNG